ncbi:uncharacterized protein LOC119574000 [Penaeus monodon]|uniref:uncharacterized protein LOC119574000 n=1 Tax=Penaeus monodon TaxID=6687 RepID=UPI0018A7A0E2|nr:uncharacterized protein LOC119574000 [Penaeus monodon]
MGAALMKRYPDLARHVIVSSDTKGSIATACQNGGIVLISGTGSNALLLNPDSKTYRCGGWGHLLGDEGGAYWIAARAVKLLFDEDDNLIDPPFNTAQLRDIVYTHFELKDRGNLYSAPFSHCTSHYKPGRPMLGQATNKDFATHVMEAALFHIPSLSQVTSALGAIYLGASVAKYDLPRDYGKNARAFFTHIQPESLGATKVATPKLQMKFPKSLTPKTQPKFPQNHTEGIQQENDLENGHSNGHANGHSNGHANGHSNGHSNGFANGHQNGHGQSNGLANGHSNGIFTLAAEGSLVDSTSR